MPRGIRFVKSPYHTIRPHYCKDLRNAIKSNDITVAAPRSLQRIRIKRRIQERDRHILIFDLGRCAKIFGVISEMIRSICVAGESDCNDGHKESAILLADLLGYSPDTES